MSNNETIMIVPGILGPADFIPVTERLEIVIESPDPLEETEDMIDSVFVLTLAYRALELEHAASSTEAARAQVRFLLDRLMTIDWRVQ